VPFFVLIVAHDMRTNGRSVRYSVLNQKTKVYGLYKISFIRDCLQSIAVISIASSGQPVLQTPQPRHRSLLNRIVCACALEAWRLFSDVNA